MNYSIKQLHYSIINTLHYSMYPRYFYWLSLQKVGLHRAHKLDHVTKKSLYSFCYSYVWTLRSTVIVVAVVRDIEDCGIVRKRCAFCYKMAMHVSLFHSSQILFSLDPQIYNRPKLQPINNYIPIYNFTLDMRSLVC